MSNMKCEIDLEWGDATYHFKLALGQLEQLQEKTGAGPEELWSRLLVVPEEAGGLSASLRAGIFKPSATDLHHVHRLGLIGGGMSDEKALGLTRRYVDERPRAESYMTARAILAAVIFGCPDDLAKKSETENDANETTQEAA